MINTYPFILIAEEGERKLINTYIPSLLKQDGSNVIVTGVGAINIISSLLSLPKDSTIVNIGYAGSANFEIGTPVIVSEVRLNHPNVTYKEPELPLQTGITANALSCNGIKATQALCYTNCDFVLQSDYHDCVFDMELAFIASLGFKHVEAMKIVSDNLSLHTYREYGSGVEQNKQQ